MVMVYTKPRVRSVIVTATSPTLASILPWSLLPPLQYIRYPVTAAPEVGASQVTLILVGPAGMAPKLPGCPAAVGWNQNQYFGQVSISYSHKSLCVTMAISKQSTKDLVEVYFRNMS